jgi:hypothetical protein
MWTPACYLFMRPFGRLETVFLNRHVRPGLAPFLELGRVSESRFQERLLGVIDIVAPEALWDRCHRCMPAGESLG